MKLFEQVDSDEKGINDIRDVPDERDLIAHARQGSTEAWRRLVSQYQQPVFRLAYLMLSDGLATAAAAEAEDVAQEVFIQAYLKLAYYDEQRPFRPWLLTITANLARNRRRSIGRHWAAIRRWWYANQAVGAGKPSFERQSDGQALAQAIQRLRPAAQQIIYLRYFLALSESETADALGIPPGTVKSRLHRALKQLRVIIEGEFPHLQEAFD